MDLIEGQDAKLFQGEGHFSQKLISDITLFNPNKNSSASLGNYGGNLNKHKGKMYNEIEIYEKNGKHYAKNKYGNNVFLTKGLNLGTKQFYFGKIDGIQVLICEQSGVNYYFLENGEQYFPEEKENKIVETTKKIIEAILPYFK